MNVFLHARGNKSVNRLTLVGAAANVGGRDVAGNIFEQVHVGAAKLRDELRRWRIGIAFGAGCSHKLRRNHELQRFGAYTRAIRNDEIAQPEQRFVFLPHRNIEKRVGADDEKNAIAGSMIGVAKIANRIHGVMQLRTSKILAGFSEGRNEMRMLGAGERNHGVAMRKWREVLFQLVRRAAGWNEMDFVKIEAAVRGA